MITRIWLYPPLAFARVGSSPTPCENFYWGPDDLSPGGTARTRIVGAETLEVTADGAVAVAACPPNERVVFKDEQGFRPVCPFFELHAAWDDDGNGAGCGAVTQELLDRFGLSASDLKWQVDVVNLKAFHFTGSPGDRVAASVRIPACSFDRHRLDGCSPAVGEPLVPPGQAIPLGTVQAIRPNEAFPGFRLRFTPPCGKVYAPTDIQDRLHALEMPKPAAGAFDPMAALDKFLQPFNEAWLNFKLPADQCLLNPAAAWPKHTMIGLGDVLKQAPNFLPRLAELEALGGPGDRSELVRALLGPRTDVGNLPPSVFAFAVDSARNLVSVGMIDDTGDGTISVELGALKATSRVVIAPPSFAPDRRLPISIADGLADRVDRNAVRCKGWVTGDNSRAADAEVHDLLDRAFETAGLQNVDAVADFFRQANENLALRRDSRLTREQARDLLWHGKKLMSVEPLPLSAVARQRHRRNTTRLVFEIFARETKGWFERAMRPPAGPERFYDKRMPGLMCGFDRYPLHLTRRQYELLKAWSEREPKS
jgi:hypothetical protein